MGTLGIIAVATLAAATGTLAQPPRKVGATSDAHFIVFAPRKHKIEQVELVIPPPAALQAIIPPINAEYGAIRYECGRLSAGGRLRRCKTTVEPTGRGYEATAAKLLGAIRVSRPDPSPDGAPIALLFVQLQVFNSARDISRGPCWPPSCVATPAPPPPPPPPHN